MPSPESLQNFLRLRAQGAAVPLVIPKLPQLPPDIVKRFPAAAKKFHEDQEKWRQDFSTALGWNVTP